MDEKEELLQQMWNEWKPYNTATTGKWRQYVVSSNEATLLETEADCVMLVKAEDGSIYVG